MSDATTAASDTAAPATATPIIPAATPSEPNWLPERLEQAKRAAKAEALKELGIDSLDAGKAAIAKAKELEESQKSELQKLNERIAALEPTAKRAAELAEVVAKHADAELAKLSDEQRAAVVAIAGDDKARALATVEALRPTWATKTAAPAPPAAPANTAPATSMPTGTQVPTVNHKATWEALKTSNPMLAAQYLVAHASDIYPPK